MAHAAAVVVAVRHAHDRQAPAKRALDDMVARSMRALQTQQVLVLQVGMRQADVTKELADKNLKLKLRMNGVTHLKTKAQKARTRGSETRLLFDTVGSTIYEGGDELCFDLCQHHRFLRSSQALASCKISLTEALRALKMGDVHKKNYSLELCGLEQPEHVLGNIVVDISISSSTLEAAGGIHALKTTVVPKKPSDYSAFAFDDYASDCRAFADQAFTAQTQLQDAFITATTSSIKSSRSHRQPQCKGVPAAIDEETTTCGSSSTRSSRL